MTHPATLPPMTAEECAQAAEACAWNATNACSDDAALQSEAITAIAYALLAIQKTLSAHQRQEVNT